MNIDCVGKKCCSCRNCELVCAFKAIEFKKDKCGFEYPEIIHEKCIDCGKCSFVCPVITPARVEKKVYSSGVAYSLDDDIKFNGSSGGLFGTFASEIISKNGIVFGAAFDNNLKLKTSFAEKKENLIPLYKSKYLLCDTNREFIHIKKELEYGRLVLYCSTPCQIYALKLFLGKEYANLFLLDFVCHGVGSQDTLDRSIEYSEKKLQAKIKKIVFRYKSNQVSSHSFCYYYEKNGKIGKNDGLYLFFPYYNAYCKQLNCRENCYNCSFASEERVSDITIGDFHEIAKYNSSIDRFSGVSMFISNTEKGQKLISQVRDKLFISDMDVDILYKNNRFSNYVIIPKERNAFIESLASDSFEKTVYKFLRPSQDWKRIIYYYSPIFIRKILKKLIGNKNEIHER